MIRQLIPYIKLFHGAYNLAVMLLFLYQALLGLRIRKSRHKGVRPPDIIRRHRNMGPVIAVLGIAGFFSGLGLVYVDTGNLLRYPFHLIAGLTIALLITSTFLISRKIRGVEPLWRDRHYALGILIMCIYPVQAFLGLGILL